MFSRLFRNRYAALLWAGGIVWTAYDVADGAPQPPAAQAANGSAATDAVGDQVDAAALATLANAAAD